MAIVSLVFGILGLTLFPVLGAIVAVITGPMAKREIYESGGQLSGEGLATAGQIMGWIGIALSFFGVCAGCCFLATLPLGILSSIFQYSLITPALLVVV